MPTLRERKYQLLIQAGFTHRESLEFSRQYTIEQLRSLPYLRTIIRTRRLYRDNLRSRGYSEEQIKRSIVYLYYKNEWLGVDGTPDIWVMIRNLRRDSIESGDYQPPPKSKGSHHPKGISKGDIVGQRLRARARQKGITTTGAVNTTLTKIAVLNRQLSQETNDKKRQALIEQRNKLWQRIS